MPTREHSIDLFVSALRVAGVVVLAYLCASDWPVLDRLPIWSAVRQHADQMMGIAGGWIAFEFLVFVDRARRAAQPPPV